MPARHLKRITLLLSGALMGALAATAWSNGPPAGLEATAGPAEVADGPLLTAQERSTIALFEVARESVVAITTEGRVRDPWTRRTHEVPQGTGSGFVWDGRGHVVTNYHVVAEAAGAQVHLADGRTFPADLVGIDPSHDLAVLRIDVGHGEVPPLARGESGSLSVGQGVMAIGNPFGLDWTLTTGIVSALDREIPTQGGTTMRGLIQTDAAINPGNSGGPLIDSSGKLVGINTAIFSPSGSSAGIGFAVPVDTLSRVVPQLISNGRYDPPVLGILHDDRIDALAHRRGINGVLVLAVQPGSPAEAAGLRPARRDGRGRFIPGDIIVAIEGVAVRSSEDLKQALDLRRAGERVTLALDREGARVEVDVTLAPSA